MLHLNGSQLQLSHKASPPPSAGWEMEGCAEFHYTQGQERLWSIVEGSHELLSHVMTILT